MFNKKSSEQEILESMEENLISNFLEKESKPLNKLDSAINHINIAAELFDDIGLTAEAEAITGFLEKFAKVKKKVKKTKSDAASKGLTSEKMVKNLKEKGWVFNADDDINNVDIEQPATFEKDYQNWLKNKTDKENEDVEITKVERKVNKKDIDPDLVGLIDFEDESDEISEEDILK
jgi:hypothetical protein